jgi:hypothetical protein
MFEECVDTLILTPIWTCRVEESYDDISISERGICFGVYALIDLIGFLAAILFSTMIVYTWSIEEYDLDFFLFVGKNPRYRPLSRLWAMRDC